MRAVSLLVTSAALLSGCRGRTTKDAADPVQHVDVPRDGKPMDHNAEMQTLRNDRIQFATMRPPGSTMPTRGRRVVVTAPPEAVTLATRGDVAVLDQLVPLLADPERAWAAEVMLAALTGHESDLVNDFQGAPETFAGSIGQGAKDRWQTWLDGVRGTLQWDATLRQFVTK